MCVPYVQQTDVTEGVEGRLRRKLDDERDRSRRLKQERNEAEAQLAIAKATIVTWQDAFKMSLEFRK